MAARPDAAGTGHFRKMPAGSKKCRPLAGRGHREEPGGPRPSSGAGNLFTDRRPAGRGPGNVRCPRKGWRRAAAPLSWSAFAAAASTAGDGAHRDRVRDLTILFGDGRRWRIFASRPEDTAPSLNRRAALRTLIDSRAPNLDSLLRQLSNDLVLRAQALIAS